MDNPILLENASLRLAVLPGMGAGLAGFDAKVNDAWQPLMRPAQLSASTTPLDLACILMLPWCSRIFDGGFSHAGRRIELGPPLPDLPGPLHGNGFVQAWTLRDRSEPELVLELESDAIEDFHYHAEVRYAIDGAALEMELSMRHLGAEPMPYGCGFHPWFVRHADTTLLAPATHFGLVDDDIRPQGWQPISDQPAWDFSEHQPLPASFIDNPFSGWNGKAEIRWPAYQRKLLLTASANLAEHCHVYSPDPDCGFFCFEPVSHQINEHNLAESARPMGLQILEHGQEMRASMRMELQEI